MQLKLGPGNASYIAKKKKFMRLSLLIVLPEMYLFHSS